MSTATQPLVVPATAGEYEADLLVASADLVGEDVVALTLVDPDGGLLPPWAPGAHVDLLLADGLIRQYSLCGSPSQRHSFRVGVLRAPDSRGGSVFIHEKLTAGATVRVRGPRNHFALVGSPRYQFIAGGIGITPLLPMLAQAEAVGADWNLLYGGRSRKSMAFTEELARYGDRVTLAPQDEAGLLDLDSVIGTPVTDTLVYCCGPEGLLTAVEQRCSRWPAGSLHLERFAARPLQAREGGERSFEVVLAQSGLTVTVPQDRSVFEAVQQAGVNVIGSCLEGTCGTCEQIVLDGEVDHRDSILSENERAENSSMMICVSRCHSDRLTLDL